MARIFIDGFETGDFGLWTSAGNATINSASLISGIYTAYTGGNGGGYFSKVIVPSKSELYFAFKLKVANFVDNGFMAFRDSASTTTINLRINSTSKVVELVLGPWNGTLLASGTKELILNTIHLVEIRYKPLNSGGVLTTKIDGVQDINYSGDTTNGLEDIGFFGFGFCANLYSYHYIDDVVVDDANWIGNTKIQAIVPTGAGATTGWTPSTGDNYAAVDEKPASDTDYVKTGSGQIDTYAMGNLSGSIASIKSVAVQTRNWREGNGVYDRGQHVVRPASTDRLAAFKTSIFPISPASFQSIWELNPEDSQPWEEADINGMEAGIKAVTA